MKRWFNWQKQMKRLIMGLLILIFVLIGCTDHPDNFSDDNKEGEADISKSVSISDDDSINESSVCPEEIDDEESVSTDSYAANSTKEKEDISPIPDPPEGSMIYEFPGEDIYCQKGVIIECEGHLEEIEEYYKLVDGHWEGLPLIQYEQTISIPHLSSDDIELSLWMALDDKKLIRAKEVNYKAQEDGLWWRQKIQSKGSWLYLNDFSYYIWWDEETQQFVDVFKDLDLSMNERGYDLLTYTPDMTKVLFRGYDSGKELVPRYYADLTTNKVYDLEEIAGETLPVVMLMDKGVIAVSGISINKTNSNQQNYDVHKSYSRETTFRKYEIDGNIFLFWQIGTRVHPDSANRDGSVRFDRQMSPYEEYNYSTVVHASWYPDSLDIDLSVLPEDMGYPTLPEGEKYGLPFQLPRLEETYIKVYDHVYQDKSYLDLPSVYKLVGNEWKRLLEQEYTDTFTLDNGTKYQMDYLLTIDNGVIVQLNHNITVQQPGVRIEIINGQSILEIRGFQAFLDDERSMIERYYLIWNPETSSFEDVFAESGLWKYAHAGRVTLKALSDDGKAYLFEIKAQMPEGIVEGDFIYEKGGKLIPAEEASEEARYALNYN